MSTCKTDVNQEKERAIDFEVRSIERLGKYANKEGVENVTVASSVFTKTQNGVRIKIWARPSRGPLQGSFASSNLPVLVFLVIAGDRNCQNGRTEIHTRIKALDSSSTVSRWKNLERKKSGAIDILISQVKEPPPFCYEFSSTLWKDYMFSRHKFIEGLSIYYRPAPNQRNIDGDFISVSGRLTWDQIVSKMADSLGETYFRSRQYIPMVVTADEGFCTTKIRRPENNWQTGRFRGNHNDEYYGCCGRCGEDMQNTTLELLIRLQGCRHVFHKTCLYDWMWGHKKCPICEAYISLDMDYANDMI
ncbi:unnamed protein product [Microthlaspi erraticum]|uniref:RING-type domain-containing protein n=1 Tax=Microthlaspi erraticum TaxID=1685480 RepID=A0A6D2ICD0_9BRAS|nr:unnamed protein product [Microthlaspi erraticum]